MSNFLKRKLNFSINNLVIFLFCHPIKNVNIVEKPTFCFQFVIRLIGSYFCLGYIIPRDLDIAINKRLSEISSNENVFNNHKNEYQDAIKNSGYNTKLNEKKS